MTARSRRARRLVELAARDDDAERRPLDRRVIRRLFALTAPYARQRNRLLMLVVLRALQIPALSWSAAAILSGPIAARNAPATQLAVVGFVALVLSTVLVFKYRIRLALELGETVIHDLRANIVNHLLSLPLGYFKEQRVGRLISRLTSDLEAVRIGIKDVAFVGIVQLGSMISAAVVMLFYDWKLFLVLAAMVPLLNALLRYFRGRLMQAYRAQQESFSAVTATIAESISGIRITQGHARGDHNSAAFRDQIADHADLNLIAARQAALFLPLFELNGQLFLAVLLAVGGYRALHHSLQFDVLLQFFFLSGLVFNPIAVLGTQYNQALTAMAGAERVFGLLDVQPAYRERPNARVLPTWRGRLELQNVSFGYRPEQPVLHDLELCVEPGQSVALVGPTGGGKSSFLALLAKFYLPDRGRILVDGIDLNDVQTASWRRQLGCVLQQNFLFSGSVLDNIRIARPDASEADVHAAARALDVLDLIEAFAQGWHTRVGERGSGLSLGQRQIVCFTRAMLSDPRLLLLDEATSAVDLVAERRLQTALTKLMQGRTTFIVAHRLSTIRHADRVLVIEAGRIVERGTHRSLLGHDGAYRRLYRQFVA